MVHSLYLVKGYWRHFKENQCVPRRDKRLDNLLRLKVFCVGREHICKCASSSLTTSRPPRFPLTICQFLRVAKCPLQIPICHPFHLFYIVLLGDICSYSTILYYWWRLEKVLNVFWSRALVSVIKKIKNTLTSDQRHWSWQIHSQVAAHVLYPPTASIQKQGLTIPHLNSALTYLWSNDYFRHNSGEVAARAGNYPPAVATVMKSFHLPRRTDRAPEDPEVAAGVEEHAFVLPSTLYRSRVPPKLLSQGGTR